MATLLAFSFSAAFAEDNCSDLRNCVKNCTEIQNCTMLQNCIENCTMLQNATESLNATNPFTKAKGTIRAKTQPAVITKR